MHQYIFEKIHKACTSCMHIDAYIDSHIMVECMCNAYVGVCVRTSMVRESQVPQSFSISCNAFIAPSMVCNCNMCLKCLLMVWFSTCVRSIPYVYSHFKLF